MAFSFSGFSEEGGAFKGLSLQDSPSRQDGSEGGGRGGGPYKDGPFTSYARSVDAIPPLSRLEEDGEDDDDEEVAHDCT